VALLPLLLLAFRRSEERERVRIGKPRFEGTEDGKIKAQPLKRGYALVCTSLFMGTAALARRLVRRLPRICVAFSGIHGCRVP
jgi:hypothetical protein